MSTAAERCAVRVLIASADLLLSELRKQIMEQNFSSIEVTCSRNRQHALALLQTDGFDILLLCGSLTAKSRAEFAAIYRQRNPGGRIVVFEGREPTLFAYDVMLPSPSTPAELISEIRELLRQIEESGRS